MSTVRAALCGLLGLAGAAAEPRLVSTPNGLWPEECVHSVPSGAQVSTSASGGVRVLHQDGTQQFHAPCEAGLARQRLGSGRNGTLTSGVGHAYPVLMWGSDVPNLQSWTASYNVPASPERDAGQTLYWWIGVEPSAMNIVLQPVLTYAGGEWSFASWNCCPSGHQFEASPVSVRPGDELVGSMTSTGGTGFEIVSRNRDGGASTLRCDDDVAMTMPLISLETYGFNDQCDLLPTGCLTLSDMEIAPATSFAQRSISMCGWTLQNSGSTVSICPPQMSPVAV